jgi:hypothetical protein
MASSQQLARQSGMGARADRSGTLCMTTSTSRKALSSLKARTRRSPSLPSPKVLPGGAPAAAAHALVITDEASQFALHSTRKSSEESNAPGRRLAGEVAGQPAGSARAQTRLGSQRMVAGRGGQGGPDAGCAVVTVPAFVSGIRCPVSSVRCKRPVSTGACPRDRCPVRRLSVQESSVRPPASVRCGVRGVRRHEVAGCGGGASRRTAGMAGVGVVARHVHDGASSAEVGAWRSKLATGRVGPAEGRLGRGRRRGR